MQIVNTVSELRNAVRAWRSAGQSVALVPTMGNLHAGHLALVNEAKEKAERVVVSIFV
ncbi:MAG: pantoate--beta-alanine ligase, partial [Methylobacter sp.]|nr:pantoate--beta-alanine ligase [Methylobacter sp.]